MTDREHEARNPHTFMPQEPTQPFALVAEFRDETAAERARASLEDAGIEAAVLGEKAEQVDTRSGLSAEGRTVVQEMGQRVALGAAIGLVAGGALGWLLWQVTIADDNPWLEVAAGAVFGLIVGALVSGIGAAGRRARSAAVRHHHPELAHWMLGVRATTPENQQRAEAILQRHGPVEVQHRPPHADR